ncbi:MAG: FliH/SctL family protein [Armatimonadota bacterium]
MAGGAEPMPWRWPRLDDLGAGEDGRGAPAAHGCAAAQAALQRDRQEAQRLVAEAHARAEQIARETREEAAREARAQFEAELRRAVAEQVAAFEQAREALLEQVRAAADERLARLEREVAALVAQMAGKVIHRTVASDDAVVLDVVRGVLARAAGAGRLTVRVAAADEPRVRAAQAELLAVTDGCGELEVVADESIGRGGCLVETERGRFDARLQTQLEALQQEAERVVGGG